MKISIIPDSFKGSLTSNEVCECIKHSINSVSNNDVFCYPMSDGGEGFANCYKNLCNGKLLYTKCHDIYNNEVDAYIVANNETAIIECALVSGLQQKKDIMNASSIGTGELIKFAINKGFKDIVVGLGGTGCCDGGIGAIYTLGGIFFDKDNNEITNPTPANIPLIHHCGLSAVVNLVNGVNFTYACDVENCFYGKSGAAYVFAKQKGATDEMLPILDDNLIHIEKLFDKSINSLKGSGAAGGLCGGLFSVTSGEIKSGFDILCAKAGIKEIIKNCDLVITGEGKTDAQTLMGKLPKKICDIAKEVGTKSVLISGSIDSVSIGDKMISLTDENITAEYAINHAKEVLYEKAKKVID